MVGWASAGISLGTFAFSCTLACVKPMRREHTRGGSHSSPVESSYPMGNYGNRNQAYQQNDWDKNQSYNGVIKEFYATQASMWWFLKHSWIPLECQKVYKKNLDEILDLWLRHSRATDEPSSFENKYFRPSNVAKETRILWIKKYIIYIRICWSRINNIYFFRVIVETKTILQRLAYFFMNLCVLIFISYLFVYITYILCT